MPIRHLNHRNLVERDANVLYPKYPLSSDIQSWIESNSDLASYESGDNDSMKQSFTHDAAIIKQSTAAWDIPPTVQKRRRGQRNSNLSSHNLPSKRQKLLPISGNAMPPQPSSPAKGTRSQSKQKANVETENQGQHFNMMSPRPSVRAGTGIQRNNQPNQDGIPTTPSSQRTWPTSGQHGFTGEHHSNRAPVAHSNGQAFAALQSPGADPFSSPLDPSLSNVDLRPYPYLSQTNPYRLPLPVSQAQSNSNSITESSDKKSGTTRSRSPKKGQTDLQLSDIPIHYINFGTPEFRLPQEAQYLYNDIRRIGNNFQVLPKFQTHVMYYMIDQGEDPHEVQREFGRPLPDDRPDGPFEGFKSADDFLLWHTVKTLQKAAMDCRNDGVSESEWNSAVNYPLLKLALKGHYENRGIGVYDVSTARIGDKSLLPGNGTKALKNESKMVDLAMVIRVKPTSTMRKDIFDLLRATNQLSVNPSQAQYLRFSPIAMPMETKATREGEPKANLQLATWIHCQFEIMTRLSRRESELPIMPMLMIQAHSWYLLIAHKWQDEIIIFREAQLSIEGTKSIIGIFQLLESLKRLASWTHHDFRKWYARNILP